MDFFEPLPAARREARPSWPVPPARTKLARTPSAVRTEDARDATKSNAEFLATFPFRGQDPPDRSLPVRAGEPRVSPSSVGFQRNSWCSGRTVSPPVAAWHSGRSRRSSNGIELKGLKYRLGRK